MTGRVRWQAASLIAIGLVMGLAAPSYPASAADGTPTAKPVKPAKLVRHLRHVVHHHPKAASKVVDSKKEADADASDHVTPSALPPGVANANARAATADVAGNTGSPPAAAVEPAITNNMTEGPAADTQAAGSQPIENPVVATDQLNDVDRMLQEKAPEPPVMVASNDASAQPAAPAPSSAPEHSVWDETSLIGKIFIGFGALLTIASAARMFMA